MIQRSLFCGLLLFGLSLHAATPEDNQRKFEALKQEAIEQKQQELEKGSENELQTRSSINPEYLRWLNVAGVGATVFAAGHGIWNQIPSPSQSSDSINFHDTLFGALLVYGGYAVVDGWLSSPSITKPSDAPKKASFYWANGIMGVINLGLLAASDLSYPPFYIMAGAKIANLFYARFLGSSKKSATDSDKKV